MREPMLENDVRESERILRAIFDGGLDPSLIVDQEWRIVDANPAATILTGVGRRHLVGRELASLFAPAHRRSLAAVREMLAQRGSIRHDFVVEHSDGSDRFVEMSATTGLHRGLQLCILHDVTEQKQLQEQLAISDRMASVGTLAAGVAHEINNPLGAVALNVELALAEVTKLSETSAAAVLFADVKEMLTDAADAAHRVRLIVKDLKLFSRNDSVEVTSVNVRNVIDSTLRLAWNEIRNRARLVKDYGQVGAIDTNEGRLGQVILNLVMNAAQAIPEGDAEGNEIRIATREDGGRVHIEVSDSSGGIPADKIDKIFESFFTTKAVGVGTGLGLSICHGIVSSLGGDISVSSEVGKGTMFRVSFPIGSVEAAQDSATPQPTPTTPAPRRARVLVLDDELLMGRSIKRLLAKTYDVVVETDARNGLARITAGEQFDVVLSDLLMPHLSGMQFHAEVKALSPTLACRIVFMSSGVFTDKARTFLREVPNHRLEKPFDRGALVAVIREIVR